MCTINVNLPEFGEPPICGTYVVFGKDATKEIASLELCTYTDEGKWYYPNSPTKYPFKVLGWIGPISHYSLNYFKKPMVRFAVSTQTNASKYRFHSGPFDRIEQPLHFLGTPGEFIYRISPNKKAVPIYKWEGKYKEGDWVKLTKKEMKGLL